MILINAVPKMQLSCILGTAFISLCNKKWNKHAHDGFIPSHSYYLCRHSIL